MVQVSSRSGLINGFTKDNLDIFLGIPYAHPPINEQRFKHSILLDHWNDPIDATNFKAIPPQPYNKLETFFSSQSQTTIAQNEDCLYLNIWKQHNHRTNKPVIIYFYGGSFVNGHGSAELYNPEHVVDNHDIIIITFNYRLGALGFLDWSHFDSAYHSNNGLSDQINVLKWVKRNIASFGGDPNNVTLMGQSAGSMSIMALMRMPQVNNLYHKAILLSGTLRLDTIEQAQIKAQQFRQLMIQQLNLTDVQQLTTANILMLMDKMDEVHGKSKGLELIYAPIQTIDISEQTTSNHPIVVCYTTDEGYIYIKNEHKKLSPQRFVEVMALNDITVEANYVTSAKQQSQAITNWYFKYPAQQFLSQLSVKQSELWLAEFAWYDQCDSLFSSAYHILDMIFWFGNLQILTAHHITVTKPVRQLSLRMQHDLVHFARTGTMPWPRYTNNNRHVYI
ncbi:carboxylesterase/lipase family protein [Staphylococcus simiae]|uniref:carboxylesterase family protein n=1 Tax=Staphylococcus simiae TaxID=308354 RepID=UPI001A974DC3|nr:carboxylesterase/lipase family protein [Staphylococcus simiae]MBO1198535.1 carboxylesterase/lipase family protein [Staphylococcus simiae]MBO1200667.1 carboxylesterase/lipase family protein [Staphylococcus simiae]MBO1202941.1 carboxylesterase/lipase family protein [Staphylococcus simiae]MBO1210526.1 carboxylesterase/lipase family protein [Staphylococcus simiae]MBO1229007.1 carboxylesterase/lipase family protein [Staphylococcus simiae]